MNDKIKEQRKRRKLRVRSRLYNQDRPKLTVFRSNKHIYAQIIDLRTGHVLVQSSDLKFKSDQKKIESAQKVGEDIAQKALKKEIKNVVFDRGQYKYHGRIKALAESARKLGLQF